MPVAPPTFRPGSHGSGGRAVSVPVYNPERRGSARERGYDTRWDKARGAYLVAHPLCVCCEANGAVVAATLVDHVKPHKGDRSLFWDQANWQGLCDWCHNNVKSVIERRWLGGRATDGELRLNVPQPGWVHPRGR